MFENTRCGERERWNLRMAYIPLNTSLKLNT